MEKKHIFMKNRNLKAPVFLAAAVFLTAALAASVLTAITFGNADISIQDVYRVILCELTHAPALENFSEGAVHDVVWLIRLPRVLMAAAVGMGLSVCGTVMQAIIKNPLADPYVLGVSSGAYLGAAASIVIGIGSVLGAASMGIMAFAGAFAASIAVLAIAGIGGRFKVTSLVLAGIAVNAVCSAFANFIIYMAQSKEATTQISYWSMGSLAAADWDNVPVTLIVMAAGTIIFGAQYRKLNLMLLGDETAITLGSSLRRTRILDMLLSALMVGFAVCAAGMIGFVGLVIPHAMRMIFGTNHRRLILLSALAGAVFLIWCDVACRVILKNAELPIGILVSLIGAPCFIALMIKYTHKGGRT